MKHGNYPALPPAWRTVPLKHVVAINPEVLPETTRADTKIEYVDIASIDQGNFEPSFKELTFESAPSRARRVLRAGDTIISTVRTYLKAVAHFPVVEANLIASTGFAVLRPNCKMHPRFGYWAALSEPFIQSVVAHSDGVSYPAINPGVLGSLPIAVPSIEEQVAIAAHLDTQTAAIDALMAKKEELLGLLDRYLRAEIIDATTRGLHPNATLSRTGVEWLPSAPSEWDVKPLANVMSKRTQKNSGLQESNLLSLSYGQVIRKDINGVEGLLPESFDGYNIVERDDIVLRFTDLQNDQRSLRTGRVRERGIITSAYLTVTPKQTLIPKYAHYLLHAYDLLKVFYTMGDGLRQSLTFNDLRKLPILVPPLASQEEIVAFLDSRIRQIEELRAKAKESIGALKGYRSALISAAVTGKLDIPTP